MRRPQDPVAGHLRHVQMLGRQPTTLWARRWHLGRLASYLGVEPGEDLLLVTTDDLDEWQHSLAHLSPAYRQSAATHVREFYRYAVETGYLEDSPAKVLVMPKQPTRVPHPIPAHDLDTAIAFAPPRVRPMLVLAAYAGLRAIEIARLTREQVRDTDTPPVLVVIGKGNKERVIPLSQRVLRELHAHGLPQHGLVFPRLDGARGPLRAPTGSATCATSTCTAWASQRVCTSSGTSTAPRCTPRPTTCGWSSR